MSGGAELKIGTALVWVDAADIISKLNVYQHTYREVQQDIQSHLDRLYRLCRMLKDRNGAEPIEYAHSLISPMPPSSSSIGELRRLCYAADGKILVDAKTLLFVDFVTSYQVADLQARIESVTAHLEKKVGYKEFIGSVLVPAEDTSRWGKYGSNVKLASVIFLVIFLLIFVNN